MTDTATECLLRMYEEHHELEDYQSGVPRWCTGCGDNAILTAVQRLCRDENLRPEKTVFVSGIGCSSRFPHYMRTYGFHGIHGRALPIAEGVRMARPDLLGRSTLMRADDHQGIFNYFVTVFSKDVKYDSERTGLGWKLVKTFEGKDLAQPTTCKMKRPDM